MLLWITTGYIGDELERQNFAIDTLVNKYSFVKLCYNKTNKSNQESTGENGVTEMMMMMKRDGNYKDCINFPDFNTFLDFVTKNYKKNYIIMDIHEKEDLVTVKKRPSFCHIHVDLPLFLRFELFKKNSVLDKLENLDINNNNGSHNDSLSVYNVFFQKDSNYHSTRTIEMLQNYNVLFTCTTDSSKVSVASQGGEMEKVLRNLETQFDRYIANSHLLNTAHPASPLRPSWDQYFMKLANLAASRCNCMKRKVGCCIVQDSRIISTGYNGTPRHLKNCFDGGCERCNSGNTKALSSCKCLHAEENALLEAGRNRIADKDCILYCDTYPCVTCSVKIVQAGISEVVYSQSYSMDDQSYQILLEGKVKVRQHKHQHSDTVVVQLSETSYKECT